MKIPVKIIKSEDEYSPMLTNGGVYREKDGTIRLYYAPF